MIKENPAKWNSERQTLTIFGKEYSVGIFESMSVTMPIGQLFRLIERSDDTITIERI